MRIKEAKQYPIPEKPIEINQELYLTEPQKWMKDFDLEYRKNPVDSGVMRMINYGGKVVTQDEYLVLRIEETINK